MRYERHWPCPHSDRLYGQPKGTACNEIWVGKRVRLSCTDDQLSEQQAIIMAVYGGLQSVRDAGESAMVESGIPIAEG